MTGEVEEIRGREIALEGEPTRSVWVGVNGKSELVIRFKNGDAETMIALSREAADAMLYLVNQSGVQHKVEL